MTRKAFVMQLKAEQEAEQEAECECRHNPIWPELQSVLRAHGVERYFIFLHLHTRQLFAFAEIKSERDWNAIAQTEVCQRWWAQMRDLMETNPDNSPVSSELREVFAWSGHAV